jgi:hypothetical protein
VVNGVRIADQPLEQLAVRADVAGGDLDAGMALSQA